MRNVTEFVLVGDSLFDRVQLGDALAGRCAGPQSAEDDEIVVAAPPRTGFLEGKKDLGIFSQASQRTQILLFRKMERGGQDADHRVLFGAETNGLAKYFGRRAETPSPQAVRNHYDGIGCRLILFRTERATDLRLDAEHVEEAGGR